MCSTVEKLLHTLTLSLAGALQHLRLLLLLLASACLLMFCYVFASLVVVAQFFYIW